VQQNCETLASLGDDTVKTEGMRWRASFIQGLGVAMGILLAFGLDALWEERGERTREAAYLTALSGELAANRRIFQDYLELLRGESDATNEALDIVFSLTPVAPDSINRAMWGLGPVDTQRPDQAALSDLLSSGGLALIEDPSVRRLVARYAYLLDQHLETQQILADFWNVSLRVYSSAHGSLVDMLPDDQLTDRMKRGVFEPDMDAFVANRTYANLLVERLLVLEPVELWSVRLLDAIDDLEESLPPAS
jgi:hypothetical protein